MLKWVDSHPKKQLFDNCFWSSKFQFFSKSGPELGELSACLHPRLELFGPCGGASYAHGMEGHGPKNHGFSAVNLEQNVGKPPFIDHVHSFSKVETI